MPKAWKKANVIPIHKKGDKDIVNNYRPISILPILSKVLERIVFKSVYNYLHVNQLLSMHQSGFRPGDSTVNQLVYMYHQFCEALDKKKDVRIVFCDISKAFDKVWHKGILYKLKKLGINGDLLNWFQDYLENRLQRVIIKGQMSWWSLIEAGVPQGSVLGPLLFLIYINDLAEAVNCSIKMFADDTCLYITVEDPADGAEILNRNLSGVHDWATQWIVNFNAEKTKSMIISNKIMPHPPIHFAGSQIVNVTKHKHLGLTLSSNLSWTEHINLILKDSSKMLEIIRKLKYDLDRKTLETIYFSFIRPKLEYACQIWDNCAAKDKERLEDFQRNVARVVTGAKKGTSHNLLNEEISWPTLTDRRRNFKIQLLHNVVNGKSPSYLSNLLPPKVGHNMQYRLRNHGNFESFNCRTEKFKQSFFPDTVKLWNDLSDEQKSIQGKSEFIQKLPNINNVSNVLYHYGERKCNIIHAQLRMQCSDLKAHLLALHVIDDPICACRIGIEDTSHFFLHCPLYYTYRLDLMNSVNAVSKFEINILLYGDDELDFESNKQIFSAVHDYIKASGRFVC